MLLYQLGGEISQSLGLLSRSISPGNSNIIQYLILIFEIFSTLLFIFVNIINIPLRRGELCPYQSLLPPLPSHHRLRLHITPAGQLRVTAANNQIFSSAWSTLIGRGMSRLRSYCSRVLLAPALLCHKDSLLKNQLVASKG